MSYSGKDSVFRIPDGKLMEGYIPSNKKEILTKWILSKQKELMKLWKALNRKNVIITIFKIDPPQK